VLKTLELLDKSKIIKQYEILDFKQGEDFYFLKIKAILLDNSNLYIRKYISKKVYLYSYHWQDENRNLRIRWDNSPHHKYIKTYPHHKHTPKIEESLDRRLRKSIQEDEAIPSPCPFSTQYGRNRPYENLKIQPQRPVIKHRSGVIHRTL